MKFKSVKKASEVTLDGVRVEFDMVDGSIKAVTLTDPKGNVVRCAERGYNFYVEVPAPPETEKKFKLSGTVLGLPVEKVFDERHEADDELRRLESDVRGDDNIALKIEQIEVPVVA